MAAAACVRFGGVINKCLPFLIESILGLKKLRLSEFSDLGILYVNVSFKTIS